MKTKTLHTYESVLDTFKHKVRVQFRSQKEAAEYFDVSDQFMSAVLLGKRSLTSTMLLWVMAKRVVMYEME